MIYIIKYFNSQCGQKQYKIISFYIVIMENNNSAIFYKTDDNRIINENCIRWVKKMSDCLEVCIKISGCNLYENGDTHKICKLNNPDSYDKLNKHFE